MKRRCLIFIQPTLIGLCKGFTRGRKWLGSFNVDGVHALKTTVSTGHEEGCAWKSYGCEAARSLFVISAMCLP